MITNECYKIDPLFIDKTTENNKDEEKEKEDDNLNIMKSPDIEAEEDFEDLIDVSIFYL